MTITNRSNPSTATWHCCTENPAFVGEFADGSAIVLCKSCRWSFAQHDDGRSVHDLPEGWSAPTPRDLAEQLAESALEMYMAHASSSDMTLAHCHSKAYRDAQFTYKAAIINAYGWMLKEHGLDADDIYALTIDSGESVRYCVDYALNHPEIHPFRI